MLFLLNLRRQISLWRFTWWCSGLSYKRKRFTNTKFLSWWVFIGVISHLPLPLRWADRMWRPHVLHSSSTLLDRKEDNMEISQDIWALPASPLPLSTFPPNQTSSLYTVPHITVMIMNPQYHSYLQTVSDHGIITTHSVFIDHIVLL